MMKTPLTLLAFTLLWFAAQTPAAAESPAHTVCLTVEEPNNYDAVNFCRGFAERELRELGHRVTIIEGNHERPTQFEGFLEAMETADLLVVFVRRATPPREQLDAIRAHLAAGKPLLGIRTANHAFVPLPNQPVTDPTLASWPEFVPEVLGCGNTGYETKGLPYRVMRHPQAPAESPLLEGVDPSAILGHASLYRVLPLAEDATPLLLGQAEGIEPAQPLAWTRTYGPSKARVFYTSLGAPEDAVQPAVRRLFVNAVKWSLGDAHASATEEQTRVVRQRQRPHRSHPPFPRVFRTFMPESGPSAFAVELAPGLGLCYDPLRGGINRAWRGSVDLAPTLRAKINEPAAIEGEVFYEESIPHPLRLGDSAAAAEHRFKGYRYEGGAVVFEYTLRGHAVTETLRPLEDDGAGLVREFAFPPGGGRAFLRVEKQSSAEVRVEGGEEIEPDLWRFPEGGRALVTLHALAAEDLAR